MLHDRQAETGARTGARLVHAVEPFEDSGQILGRDARTRVGHFNGHLSVAAPRADADVGFLRRVVDRVLDQVADDIVQLCRIRINRARIALDGNGHLLPLRLDRRREVGHD